MLVRNYDYAPSRFEGDIWHTQLLGDAVIGMSDCLWGLLDGMNDDGPRRLAHVRRQAGARATGSASRSSSGTCWRRAPRSDEARDALARLPYSLSHNLTIVDRRRRGPHRVPLARPRADLPRLPGWRRTTRGSSSGPSRRARPGRSNASRRSCALLEDDGRDRGSFADAFMQAPLFSTVLRARVRHALHGRVPGGRGMRSSTAGRRSTWRAVRSGVRARASTWRSCRTPTSPTRRSGEVGQRAVAGAHASTRRDAGSSISPTRSGGSPRGRR